MEMPEGWKRWDQGIKDCLNSQYLKMMGEDQRSKANLMKEMAEAIDYEIRINNGDTTESLKEALKKFKELK